MACSKAASNAAQGLSAVLQTSLSEFLRDDLYKPGLCCLRQRLFDLLQELFCSLSLLRSRGFRAASSYTTTKPGIHYILAEDAPTWVVEFGPCNKHVGKGLSDGV